GNRRRRSQRHVSQADRAQQRGVQLCNLRRSRCSGLGGGTGTLQPSGGLRYPSRCCNAQLDSLCLQRGLGVAG
ncbi:unnamed protein product, partial [Symbiodinium pilosum]